MRFALLVVALTACSNERCRKAYREFDRTWRAGVIAETASMRLPQATVETMIHTYTDTLPTRDELAAIRQTHEVGIRPGESDLEWQAAWPAAEEAIDACGEGAARP
jgi:hypothetical protein